MTRAPRLLPGLLALFLLLPGCASPQDGQDGLDPIVVTAPDDYRYLEQPGAAQRQHVHDYWGGQDRLTIVDEERASVAQLFITGPNWATFMEFLPPDGHVVPQGTAYLEATLEARPNPGDNAVAFALSARGADDRDIQEGVVFEAGRARLPSDNSANDLPHQVLSAWRFYVSGLGEGGVFRFTGTLHLRVEAVRGLEIPLYPGHPDQWNGSSQITLLDEEDDLYDVHVDEPQEMCLPLQPLDQGPWLCAHPVSPLEGRLVPADASHVTVTITMTQGTPLGLDFTYHGADTQRYTRLDPDEERGSTRTYVIPVAGNGDGPYARQSLWSFYVRGSSTLPQRLVEAGTYHISAIAYKDPAQGPAPDGIGAATGDAPSPASRDMDIVVAPGNEPILRLRGNGTPVRIEAYLYNGVSRDGMLVGPGTCNGKLMTMMVVGVSTNGQRLVRSDCGPVNGTTTLTFNAGASAFRGFVRLTNATFV